VSRASPRVVDAADRNGNAKAFKELETVPAARRARFLFGAAPAAFSPSVVTHASTS